MTTQPSDYWIRIIVLALLIFFASVTTSMLITDLQIKDALGANYICTKNELKAIDNLSWDDAIIVEMPGYEKDCYYVGDSTGKYIEGFSYCDSSKHQCPRMDCRFTKCIEYAWAWRKT